MRSIPKVWMTGLVGVAIFAASCSIGRIVGPGSKVHFDSWVTQDKRAEQLQKFDRFLQSQGVADVAPAWTLWRQGTDWAEVGQPAFAVPPEKDWPAIIPTLKLLRDEVVPLVGDVEVVSAWRSSTYNSVAGGAASSRHLYFEAVDVQPERNWVRQDLHSTLLTRWRAIGPKTGWGLGLYERTRFHVDTHRHRKWGG
ncbi:MAG: D-Ala-D-Ala carboxypeptidase family metallohydrolase [Myxococcota bacterium]